MINWLKRLVIQQKEAFNLYNKYKVDLQFFNNKNIPVYSRFLLKLIKASLDNREDPQVVYSLLAKNTNKLDKISAKILRITGTHALEKVKTDEEAESLAAMLLWFSFVIQEAPVGNKANNMEIAIAGYEIALKVYTYEDFPEYWVMTQRLLGLSYSDRILGNKADNIENTIAAFTNTLNLDTIEALPQNCAQIENNLTWAATQNNLGIAYTDRILGNKADNIENAITAFTAALTIYTKEAFPQGWAKIQNNLAIIYRNAIKGDEADNIEKAIHACNEALTVYTKEAFPQDWAKIQNDLGNSYGRRILGDKADNIENAIAAFTSALTIYTKEAFPQDWAKMQRNLGGAYSNRILGEKAENIKKAIAALTNTLTVYTQKAFPQDYAETLWLLGNIYQKENDFQLAYNTFKSTILTIETLRQETISGDESKREQAEYFNKVYTQMIEVCLELGNITAAIEYAEDSKTRNLIEQILKRESKFSEKLEKCKDKIAAEQYKIRKSKSEDTQALTQSIQKLRQQFNGLHNAYGRVNNSFDFNLFQSTLNNRTVIIEWYILESKILVFIITSQREIKVWQSQPKDLEDLFDWLNKYLKNYYGQTEQLQDKLRELLQELASILHINEILNQIPNHCNQIILIPHQFLHLLPLHALPVNQNSENCSYLIDYFPYGVSYAPSCQILQQLKQQQNHEFQSLFAIQNPTGDLEFTNDEVNSILSLFPNHKVKVLSNNHATKAALDLALPNLQEINYLHFSCHGSFNLESPLDSFLLLADAEVDSIPTNAEPKQYLQNSRGGFIDLSKCLTLGNLFEQGFKLKKCRLVVLSACETGLIDFSSNSDEYIGLPNGFLYAGSSNVVSSLWTVNDESTAYLMIKFLQNLKQSKNVSVAVALNQAQNWLRNITWKDLDKWKDDNLRSCNSNNPQIERSIRKMREIIAKKAQNQNINEKPFESPYHWAGFTAIGK